MKRPCNGCPWSDTPESEQAQNYGCLPTANDMVRLNASGSALSCHENDGAICRGLAAHIKDSGAKLGKIKKHTDWYLGK